MWLIASISNKLHLNPSRAVRKSYFKLLSNVLVMGDGVKMRIICDKFVDNIE
jgi:hypothetical protein